MVAGKKDALMGVELLGRIEDIIKNGSEAVRKVLKAQAEVSEHHIQHRCFDEVCWHCCKILSFLIS